MGTAWAELTPGPKRAERLKRRLSPPGITFPNPNSEKRNKERVACLSGALLLQKQDRIPRIFPTSMYASYAGNNPRKVMYHCRELVSVRTDCLQDFDPDAAQVPPGRAFDATDYEPGKWPGHGIPGNAVSCRAVKTEQLKPDEYGRFNNTPPDHRPRAVLSPAYSVRWKDSVRPDMSAPGKMIGNGCCITGNIQSGQLERCNGSG